jgi:hypothetical protein
MIQKMLPHQYPQLTSDLLAKNPAFSWFKAIDTFPLLNRSGVRLVLCDKLDASGEAAGRPLKQLGIFDTEWRPNDCTLSLKFWVDIGSLRSRAPHTNPSTFTAAMKFKPIASKSTSIQSKSKPCKRIIKTTKTLTTDKMMRESVNLKTLDHQWKRTTQGTLFLELAPNLSIHFLKNRIEVTAPTELLLCKIISSINSDLYSPNTL